MTMALVFARVLLATVFVVAGLAKLADLHGSRRSMAAFGVPARLTGPAGVLLPFAELIIAIALIPSFTAPWGALGALGLLAVFVAGITVNLARGRQPDCHCFGQLHSTPIGTATIARNVALMGVAAFVVLAGGLGPAPSVLGWAGPLTPMQHVSFYGGLALLALMAVQSRQLSRIIRQNEQLLARTATPPAAEVPGLPRASTTAPAASVPAAGHPVGTPAPAFTLPALDGRTWSLDELRAAGKPLVLFFSDPNCGPCQTLLPEIAELEQTQSHVMTVALVTRGTAEANREKIQGRISRVLLQKNREVFEAFGVVGTPTVVVVSPDGTIGSALAQGDAAIRLLLAPMVRPQDAAAAPVPAPGAPAAIQLRPGDPAPEFNLVDLDGTPLTLDRFSDQPRLVLFWNPGCGYCQRMLPDLKAWEAGPDTSRPRLIVISAGSVEDNRALGLQAPIGIDPDGFAVAGRYGVAGTPSAALIDASGRLTAEIAVGAPAILALAGGPPQVAAPANPLLELTEDARPRKERCVHDELLSDGSMILYNGCRHQVMTLNPTAALVWEYCEGDLSIDGIIAELREIFPQAANMDRDVRTVLQNLLISGMISTFPQDESDVPAGVGSDAETAS